ncbi:peptidase M16, partial [Achromatium sp. WMS3]
VTEERRLRTDDNPTALTVEHFYAAAYMIAPYRNPIIGWMSDLKTMSVDKLQTWYQKWYAPNNATLVVVGDVEPTQIFALANKYFGHLQAEKISHPIIRTEPKQLGLKRIAVKAPAKESYLVMGYKTPTLEPTKLEDWEPYALDMLSYILDGGSSARFSKQLIRGSQIASNIDADYSIFNRLPEMLTIDGTPAKGHTVAELEQAIRKQITRLQQEPVSPKELQRVRQQIIAKKIFLKDSIFYQAMEIGILETVGLKWQLADEYVSRISAVTAEQVQLVAQKYLVDDNLTIAVLEPQPLDSATHPVAYKGASNIVR